MLKNENAYKTEQKSMNELIAREFLIDCTEVQKNLRFDSIDWFQFVKCIGDILWELRTFASTLFDHHANSYPNCSHEKHLVEIKKSLTQIQKIWCIMKCGSCGCGINATQIILMNFFHANQGFKHVLKWVKQKKHMDCMKLMK